MSRNDIKCKYLFMFTLKNLARKGLTHWRYCSLTPNHLYEADIFSCYPHDSWHTYSRLHWYVIFVLGVPGEIHYSCLGSWLIEAWMKWLTFGRQHFQCIVLNEAICILIQIHSGLFLKLVPAKQPWRMFVKLTCNKPEQKATKCKPCTYIRGYAYVWR